MLPVALMAVLVGLALVCAASEHAGVARPNVVFIVVDDLNPSLQVVYAPASPPHSLPLMFLKHYE